MNVARQQMCLMFDQLTISHLRLGEQVKEAKNNVTKESLKVLEEQLREQALRLVAAADVYENIAEELLSKQALVVHRRDGLVIKKFKADVTIKGHVRTVTFPHLIICLSGDTVSYDTAMSE